MQLNGLHHVTSISRQIGQNASFYTQLLGLRLVKKSVNQDDTSAYHLFYADKVGSPGTDMTFFDWSHIPQEARGTDSIVLTAFRVASADALAYWVERFDTYNVQHSGIEQFGDLNVLRFEDPEGQRLMLVDDGGAPFHGEAWDGAGIPAEHALRGFYAAMLSVPAIEQTTLVLTHILNMTEARTVTYPTGQQVHVFAMDGGGPGNELWVMVEPNAPIARSGAGGTHHIAFRVANEAAQADWNSHIQRIGLPTSGHIDRYYFKSIYFRISGGILFEIATDGPGFAVDEDMETLGERLALPPFLEPQRALIEARIKPIVMPALEG